MNLLLATNLFPTPGDPERGIFTLQLARRLQRHCRVTVVCPLPWFPDWKLTAGIRKYAEFAGVPDNYIIDDVEIYAPRYPLIPKLSENLHAFFMRIGIQRTIARLHREIGFDVVNSQWLYPDSVAMGFITDKLKLPHVATGLGCDVNHDIYQPVKGESILNTLQNCPAITVVSNGLRQELVDNGVSADKIHVIPNGIDTEHFRIQDKNECRAQLGIEPGGPMLLYVGRLSEEKDPATMLRALQRLQSRDKPLSAYLVGDGPLMQELRELVRQLGLEQSVTFVGKVSHKLIDQWMGATDFLCLPSLREGCPNVILEALGSGRPVIASRVGAIPDVVTAHSGILFTPGDVEQLAEAMETALETLWSDTVIKASVSKLSWEAAAENYASVFRQVIDNGPSLQSETSR